MDEEKLIEEMLARLRFSGADVTEPGYIGGARTTYSPFANLGRVTQGPSQYAVRAQDIMKSMDDASNVTWSGNQSKVPVRTVFNDPTGQVGTNLDTPFKNPVSNVGLVSSAKPNVSMYESKLNLPSSGYTHATGHTVIPADKTAGVRYGGVQQFDPTVTSIDNPAVRNQIMGARLEGENISLSEAQKRAGVAPTSKNIGDIGPASNTAKDIATAEKKAATQLLSDKNWTGTVKSIAPFAKVATPLSAALALATAPDEALASPVGVAKTIAGGITGLDMDKFISGYRDTLAEVERVKQESRSDWGAAQIAAQNALEEDSVYSDEWSGEDDNVPGISLPTIDEAVQSGAFSSGWDDAAHHAALGLGLYGGDPGYGRFDPSLDAWDMDAVTGMLSDAYSTATSIAPQFALNMYRDIHDPTGPVTAAIGNVFGTSTGPTLDDFIGQSTPYGGMHSGWGQAYQDAVNNQIFGNLQGTGITEENAFNVMANPNIVTEPSVQTPNIPSDLTWDEMDSIISSGVNPLASPDITAQDQITAYNAASMGEIASHPGQGGYIGDTERTIGEHLAAVDDRVQAMPAVTTSQALSTQDERQQAMPAVTTPQALAVQDERQQAMPEVSVPAPTAPTVAAQAAQNRLAQQQADAAIARAAQAAAARDAARQASAARQQEAARQAAAQAEANAAIDRVAQARAIMNSRDYQEGGAGNLSAAQRDVLAAAQVDTFAGMPMGLGFMGADIGREDGGGFTGGDFSGGAGWE